MTGISIAIQYRGDATIWPVAALGPLLSLTFSSEGGKNKAVGNLGEVVLMATLVFLQSKIVVDVN